MTRLLYRAASVGGLAVAVAAVPEVSAYVRLHKITQALGEQLVDAPAEGLEAEASHVPAR